MINNSTPKLFDQNQIDQSIKKCNTCIDLRNNGMHINSALKHTHEKANGMNDSEFVAKMCGIATNVLESYGEGIHGTPAKDITNFKKKIIEHTKKINYNIEENESYKKFNLIFTLINSKTNFANNLQENPEKTLHQKSTQEKFQGLVKNYLNLCEQYSEYLKPFEHNDTDELMKDNDKLVDKALTGSSALGLSSSQILTGYVKSINSEYLYLQKALECTAKRKRLLKTKLEKLNKQQKIPNSFPNIFEDRVPLEFCSLIKEIMNDNGSITSAKTQKIKSIIRRNPSIFQDKKQLIKWFEYALINYLTDGKASEDLSSKAISSEVMKFRAKRYSDLEHNLMLLGFDLNNLLPPSYQSDTNSNITDIHRFNELMKFRTKRYSDLEHNLNSLGLDFKNLVLLSYQSDTYSTVQEIQSLINKSDEAIDVLLKGIRRFNDELITTKKKYKKALEVIAGQSNNQTRNKPSKIEAYKKIKKMSSSELDDVPAVNVDSFTRIKAESILEDISHDPVLKQYEEIITFLEKLQENIQIDRIDELSSSFSQLQVASEAPSTSTQSVEVSSPQQNLILDSKYSYHPRVSRWFTENPVEEDSKYQKIKDKEVLDKIHLFHSFSSLADPFVFKYGVRIDNLEKYPGSEQYALPCIIKTDDKEYRGKVIYCVDKETGVIWHRCFKENGYETFRTDFINDSIWINDVDFPKLSSAYSKKKKSNSEKKLRSVQGQALVDDESKVIDATSTYARISDPKNKAEIILDIE